MKNGVDLDVLVSTQQMMPSIHDLVSQREDFRKASVIVRGFFDLKELGASEGFSETARVLVGSHLCLDSEVGGSADLKQQQHLKPIARETIHPKGRSKETRRSFYKERFLVIRS